MELVHWSVSTRFRYRSDESDESDEAAAWMNFLRGLVDLRRLGGDNRFYSNTAYSNMPFLHLRTISVRRTCLIRVALQ
jgi:hypothetical protein